MDNFSNENHTIKTEAAQYTLAPGENVLLELKVKEFMDDGTSEIAVSSTTKNPLAFIIDSVKNTISAIFAPIKKIISAIFAPITNMFGCCKEAESEYDAVATGLFVITTHRCFISKANVEKIKAESKKSCIASILGSAKNLVGAFNEEHEFIAFPRSVLTEYNSFTCKKEFTFTSSQIAGCCCSQTTRTEFYKTVLTIGLNKNGEHSSIAPVETLKLVLDPSQVSNYEQALAVMTKLAELAQKAN